MYKPIMKKKLIFSLLTSLVVGACTYNTAVTNTPGNTNPSIDQRSYKLGNIGAFGEMVNVGIKKLALSAALSPEEMDALIEEAARVAKRNNVEIHREKEFLVTDLFPESVTNGKHVLLIYKGSTKEEYMALKNKKAKLIELKQYKGQARKEIARQFGRMLSYPESKIDELINQNKPEK